MIIIKEGIMCMINAFKMKFVNSPVNINKIIVVIMDNKTQTIHK